MKIKNIEDLRNMVLDTIEKLQQKKIDINEGAILAKMSETVISGLKVQMEYARLTDQIAEIPFIQGVMKKMIIEHEPRKQIDKK